MPMDILICTRVHAPQASSKAIASNKATDASKRVDDWGASTEGTWMGSLAAAGEPVSVSDIYMISWRECAAKIVEENRRLEEARQGSGNSRDLQELEAKLAGCEQAPGVAGVPKPGPLGRLMRTRLRVVMLKLKTGLSASRFPPGRTCGFVGNLRVHLCVCFCVFARARAGTGTCACACSWVSCFSCT